MTAQRWWVRLAARWLARVDGVSGQLRLAMLALTGVSTMSVALQNYGLGQFTPPIIVLIAVAGAAFAYFYTEGGVWNQMSRDRQDMSNNYAGPSQRINAELVARSLAAAEKGEPLSEAERAAVTEEATAAFDEHRDGVEIAED